MCDNTDNGSVSGKRKVRDLKYKINLSVELELSRDV